MRALLEGSIEFDLAHLAVQGGLSELGDSEEIVRNAVGGALRIKHLQILDAVDSHHDVVAGDAILLGNVDGLLLEGVPVANRFHKRHQDGA